MHAPILLDIPEALETERLFLRSPRPGDGEKVNEAIKETFADLRAWMPWAHVMPTVEESEANARQAQARFLERSDLTLFMFLKSSWTFLGGTGLHRIDWDVPRFEIGYWIRKGHRGNGYVTEAVRALTAFAFDALEARRVEIRCSHRNVRSQKVAERAGFPLEATLKNAGRDPSGELRHTLIYALTEAPPLRPEP